MTPAPRLLIFDLDGTLIDSRRDIATAMNLIRARHGLPALPVETVSRYVGDGVRMLVERSLAGVAVDIDEAVEQQKALYRQHLHDETTLYPGVRDGLRALSRAGHRLALATNKEHVACELILVHFGLRPLFTAGVLGGGMGVRLKPDPEMIQRLMRDNAAGAGDTWMVGDHATDIRAARAAGVGSVFLESGIGRVGDDAPTLAYADFAEFTRAFLAGAPPAGGARA